MCFAEAISFELLGNTLGKFILGISLSKKSNKPLTFEDSLIRAFNVLVTGNGLLIPIVGIITMITSKLRLEEKGETRWDEELGFKISIQPINATSYVLYIFAFLIAASVHLASIKSMATNLNHGAVRVSSANKKLAEIRAQDPSTKDKTDLQIVQALSTSRGVSLEDTAGYLGIELPK